MVSLWYVSYWRIIEFVGFRSLVLLDFGDVGGGFVGKEISLVFINILFLR